MTLHSLPESVFNIHGFLSQAEGELLYRLATAVKPGGVIVEIGSFQGRSTVCLGLGAKQAGAQMWAIDPHEDYQVTAETHYGMENYAALLKNLVCHEVADTVRLITLPSMKVVVDWRHFIDLLWIDGSHEKLDVYADLVCWSAKMRREGLIALHDASGHFPGVTEALQDFMADMRYQVVEQVDATKVLSR